MLKWRSLPHGDSWGYFTFVTGIFLMSDLKPDSLDSSQQRQMGLSRWDNEGGAGPCGPQGGLISGEVQSEVPQLTNAELVQLRIRVIALENLVISLLAEVSDRQLDLAREMAAFISPRPGFTHHPLTIHAATQMIDLIDRASHFRAVKPS
jgi:hypothetical protein